MIENPFFKNFGKKTIAIIISILLWIVANLEFDIEKNIDIPINYSNLNPGLIITNNPPESISIKLKGPRSQISTLSNSNTIFNFDLSSYSSGMRKMDIAGDELNFPREVDVTGISPASIELKIDDLITKTVKLKPVFNLPDQGYRIVDEPKIEPTSIKVSGPKQILSDLKSLNTNLIELEGEKSEISIQVPIKTSSQLIKVLDDKLAKVTIKIEEVNLEKEFKDIKISFKNFKDINYKLVENGKANLTFDGPFTIINGLNNEDIEVYVDGKEIDNQLGDIHNLKVNVNFPHPSDLKLTKLKPETIKVKIN